MRLSKQVIPQRSNSSLASKIWMLSFRRPCHPVLAGMGTFSPLLPKMCQPLSAPVTQTMLLSPFVLMDLPRWSRHGVWYHHHSVRTSCAITTKLLEHVGPMMGIPLILLSTTTTTGSSTKLTSAAMGLCASMEAARKLQQLSSMGPPRLHTSTTKCLSRGMTVNHEIHRNKTTTTELRFKARILDFPFRFQLQMSVRRKRKCGLESIRQPVR
mmetsp:Transcript_37068/g.54459  ORF Transcript_37068/g.54459 Transcript_37068/m.54459 type:complete len:212 (+) Transcript_37068:2750-3385(+)